MNNILDYIRDNGLTDFLVERDGWNINWIVIYYGKPWIWLL